MDLEDLLNKILSLEGKEDEIIEEITDYEETQTFLINVLQNQLFTTGEDGLGNSLGSYTAFTVAEKKRKGQPFDRITLKDTGDFYQSYFVTAFKGGFIIDADAQKTSGNLFVRFGDDVLLPNTESLELIKEYYVEQLIKYFQNLFV